MHVSPPLPCGPRILMAHIRLGSNIHCAHFLPGPFGYGELEHWQFGSDRWDSAYPGSGSKGVAEHLPETERVRAVGSETEDDVFPPGSCHSQLSPATALTLSPTHSLIHTPDTLFSLRRHTRSSATPTPRVTTRRTSRKWTKCSPQHRATHTHTDTKSERKFFFSSKNGACRAYK